MRVAGARPTARDDLRTRLAGVAWHRVVLAWAIITAVVPIVPHYPTAGLDSAWETGLNRALDEGLVFGRDIVFTYGPYAATSTRAYDPTVGWIGILGGLVLAAGYLCAALVLTARARPWRSWLIAAAVLLGLVANDVVLLTYPLTVFLLLLHDFPRPRPGEQPRRAAGPGRLVRLGVVSAPLGLLPIDKISTMPPVVGGILLGLVLLALRRQWAAAVVLLIGPPVAMVVLWVVAGQPLAALPDFLGTFTSVVGSYSEAMSIPGTEPQVIVQIVLALVTGVLLVGCARRGGRDRSERLLLALMVLGTLFLGWKSGFVRADGHVRITEGMLVVVAALVVPSIQRRAVAVGTATIGLLAVVLYEGTTASLTPGRYAGPLRDATLTAVRVAAQRVVTPDRLDRQYADSLRDIRHDRTIRMPRGARSDVDLYGNAQFELFARHAHWDPRPVFQSYVAYDAHLAGLNADHLRRDGAAFVLFRVESIDTRLPAMEDGPSLVPLLENYDLVRLQPIKQYLVLKRRAAPRPLVRGATVVRHGELGRPVRVPAGPSGWLASFDVDQSPFGKLATTLWRPPLMQITIRTRQGGVFVAHFVPSMAERQFLLSPTLFSTSELAGIFAPGRYPDTAQDVSSIQLDVSGPNVGVWRDHFSVRLQPVELPTAPAGTTP